MIDDDQLGPPASGVFTTPEATDIYAPTDIE
jgi:hypothetical protein